MSRKVKIKRKIRKFRRRKKIKRADIIVLLVSIPLIILLGYYMPKIYKARFEISTEVNTPYYGSDVRRESYIRKFYEQKYREKKDKNWSSTYDTLLQNQQDIDWDKLKEMLDKKTIE